MTLSAGLHYGVPEAEYFALDALSRSQAGLLMECPAKYRYAIDAGDNSTSDALVFGSAVHCAVLERDRFRTDYAVAPKIDRRTKAGKEAYAALEQDRRILLTEDRHAACEHIAEHIHADPVWRAMWDAQQGVEIVSLWEREGHLCKARIDMAVWRDAATNALVDLKTTESVAARKFAVSCKRYGYHRQAAWYLDAMAAHGYYYDRFLIVAVEKQAPYLHRIFRLCESDIAEGRRQNDEMFRTFKQCKENDYWPDYTGRIDDLTLPNWEE